MQVTLITTGGTIDGADSDKGTLREHSDAAEWMEQQEGVQLNVIDLLNKDSRLIDEDDRESILAAAEQSDSGIILITHGTYTVAETGRFLKKNFAGTDKTILLIGAWVPFCETDSDAPQQMKFALKTISEDRPSGVFVAMDGELWNPDTTCKRETTPGVFVLENSL